MLASVTAIVGLEHLYLTLLLGVAELARLAFDFPPREAAALIVSTGVIVSAWAAVEGRRVMVRRVEVPIAKLPAVLDGMSFVQLSDVHLGTTVGRRFMEAVVARANSNHEYHAGAMRWCAHLESLGVRVLRNELVPLERDGQVLQLAGTDDSDPAWRAEGFEEKLELAP